MPDDDRPKLAEKAEEHQKMAGKWKAASARWAKDVKLNYLSNPAARRDLQVQFRGNRGAPLLISLVVVMVVVTLYLYWKMTELPLEPEQVQSTLMLFCAIIFAVLAVAVSLIAPVLAAASILAEKERRSLDLVFSSPIKPKTYLLGKLAASYRYVWVFMALSLPFTAMSVIMGGGNWVNILEAYFLLSLQGLLFTTIGVYFAALVEKTISALLYTYVVVIGYIWMGYLFVRPELFGSGSSLSHAPFQGGHLSFVTSLVPLYIMFAAGTTTPILGISVPNVFLALGFTLAAVNFILTCAAGLLSPIRQRERTSLRIKCTVIVGLVAALIAYSVQPSGDAPSFGNLVGTSMVLPSFILLFFLPFLACFGSGADRRHAHGKLFVVRDLFGKSVAGALPFVLSLFGVSAFTAFLGAVASHKHVSIDLLGFIAYGLGFWTFAWATARFASSFCYSLKTSRTLQVLTLAAVIGGPLPIFVELSAKANGDPSVNHAIWQWFSLSPIIGQSNGAFALLHGFLFLIAGVGLASWSEKNFARLTAKRKLSEMALETTLATSPVSIPLTSNLVADASAKRLSQRT